MKIRDDLEGVVYLSTEEGVVVLKAGDTVPSGATVGDHLLAKAAPKPAASSRSRKADDDSAAG